MSVAFLLCCFFIFYHFIHPILSCHYHTPNCFCFPLITSLSTSFFFLAVWYEGSSQPMLGILNSIWLFQYPTLQVKYIFLNPCFCLYCFPLHSCWHLLDFATQWICVYQVLHWQYINWVEILPSHHWIHEFFVFCGNWKHELFSLSDVSSELSSSLQYEIELLFVSEIILYCFWIIFYILCSLQVVLFCLDSRLVVSTNTPANLSSWAISRQVLPSKPDIPKIKHIFSRLVCEWAIILQPGLLQQTIFLLHLASVHPSTIDLNQSLMLVSNPQTKHLDIFPLHFLPNCCCSCPIRLVSPSWESWYIS